MDSRDPAATFLSGQFEGIVSDAEGVGPRDDFQTLYNSWYTLKHKEIFLF